MENLEKEASQNVNTSNNQGFQFYNQKKLEIESEANLIKIFDVCRRTVESFDRSIVTIRQMYLVAIGIIVAAAATIFKNNGTESTIFFSLGIFVILITFVFWGMDSHYHNYLRISAQTSQRVEKILKMDAERISISKELGSFRRQDLFSSTYTFFYIIIWIIGLYIMSITIPSIEIFPNFVTSLAFYSLSGLLIIMIILLQVFGNIKIDKYFNSDKYEEHYIDQDLEDIVPALSKEQLGIIQKAFETKSDELFIKIGISAISVGLLCIVAFMILATAYTVDATTFVYLFTGSIFFFGFGIALILIPTGRMFRRIINYYKKKPE
ncbi:MAG: hypothetical protein A4E32_00508 [Methanomassiliicoccales archaeon PtaU1.Bin124]|nr:MAG: hypothetical protein A4E32_00508 [Methanomassiliicoccales archaeon PtaU1.Bin124]